MRLAILIVIALLAAGCAVETDSRGNVVRSGGDGIGCSGGNCRPPNW